MKIVITGALGHIGSYLSRSLPKYFHQAEIVMIDNMATQRYSSLFNLSDDVSYSLIEADVLSADLEQIFTGADVVVHLAAITNAANSFAIKEEVERVNYNATVKVAEACSKTGSSLIHLSSTSVYGTQKEVVDEDCSDDELNPQSPYAETKLKEEAFLVSLANKSQLKFVVCRFGTICGVSPGMRFHTAVNKFCWQANLGQSISVWRTALHQKRPYLALDEASEAINFIIDKNLFDNRIYNVLTDNLTVYNIIDMIKTHIPNLRIKYVDNEIMNQLSYEVLNQRIRSQGFSYQGNIQCCIDDTLKLLHNTGVKNDRKEPLQQRRICTTIN